MINVRTEEQSQYLCLLRIYFIYKSPPRGLGTEGGGSMYCRRSTYMGLKRPSLRFHETNKTGARSARGRCAAKPPIVAYG
jgi:hypothetical protein